MTCQLTDARRLQTAFEALLVANALIKELKYNAFKNFEGLGLEPLFVNDETAHGIPPVNPTALSWTFRWSSGHRSNRPFQSSHNLVRPTVGNRGILPWVPNRIPTRHYWRCLGDLPCCPIILRVHVRRFRCINDACPRRTFGEPLPRIAGCRARHTERLRSAHHAIALALGGNPGAHMA